MYTQGAFVLKAGLEPARTNVHWILSPACLPIPPLEQRFYEQLKKITQTNNSVCQKKTPHQCKELFVLKAGLEPARTNVHWILSPACLPIPPLERYFLIMERKTGFEPATSTLARLRSTN